MFSRAPLWLMSSFSGSLHFMYMETTPSLKRTISQRSNSDSSESSSLWEKRPKSLAEEDEVLQVLNIAGNVSEKLDKILGELKKLEKLDAIEATLKDLTSRLGKVESTIDKMKETHVLWIVRLKVWMRVLHISSKKLKSFVER